jgi:hypothetical protein
MAILQGFCFLGHPHGSKFDCDCVLVDGLLPPKFLLLVVLLAVVGVGRVLRSYSPILKLNCFLLDESGLVGSVGLPY